MNKTMSKSFWQEHCQNLIFTDCEIDADNNIYLLAHPIITQDELHSMDGKDFISYLFLLADDSNSEYLSCYRRQFTNLSRPMLGISAKPQQQLLVISKETQGIVYPMTNQQIKNNEKLITESIVEIGAAVCGKTQCIDGYFWVAGLNQNIYKRVALNNWAKIRNGLIDIYAGLSESDREDPDVLEQLFDDFNPGKMGFNHIDGFSENDIYAVGNGGDIWMFDGEIWQQCGFPTNKNLDVVCCANDGNVYVANRTGIWQGRKHQWKQIAEYKRLLSLNDICWFADKLWLAFDDGILVWDGKQLSDRIIYKGTPLPLSGSMSTNGKQLVIANAASVWTFDGKDWFDTVPMFSLINVIEETLANINNEKNN